MKTLETFSGSQIKNIITEAGPAPKESVFHGMSLVYIWSVANETEVDTKVFRVVDPYFDAEAENARDEGAAGY